MTSQTEQERSVQVRRNVGWTELTDWGVLAFEGEDAAKFLHGQLSQNIQKLADGAGHRLALLDRKAKVYADMLFYRWGNAYFALLQKTLVSTTLERLESVHFAEKIAMTDATDRYALLAVQGLKKEPLLKQLKITTQQLAPHTVFEARISSVAVRVVHESLTGGPGVLLLVATEDAEAVRAALIDAGQSLGLVRYGQETAEVLRVEAGLPKYGVDVTEQNLLPELGREEMLCYDKGCYLGQEIVARIKTYGQVNRLLVGLVLESESSVPQADAPVRSPETDDAVGRVTSAVYSASLGRPIALGYVKQKLAETGQQLEIEVNGTRVNATVSALPFVPDIK